MKPLLRLLALMLTGMTGIAAGCAAPVRVDFDPQQDFALYRTWAWAPGVNYHIETPDPSTAHDLHLRIKRLIEDELATRGLRRVPARGAELLVAYRLLVRNQLVRIERTRPRQTLVGSLGRAYTVEPKITEILTYEHGQLVIGLANPNGKLIWVGQLDESQRDPFADRVETAVANVLGPFPPPSRPGGRGPMRPIPLDSQQRLLAAMFPGQDRVDP